MKFLRYTLIALALGLPASALATEPVNINTADAATLARAIDGVGESKAQAIVDYRVAHGPFESVDELSEVKGIGEKTVLKNRDKLSVK